MRAEQIRLIFRQAVPAQAISVVAGAVLCFILWDLTDQRLLVGWLALLVALGATRLSLVAAFQGRAPTSDIVVWEQRFVVSLVVTAAVWGVGGWLIMPPDSIAHQAVVYFFLMGMAGGAVTSYAAHGPSTYVTISVLLLPSTAWLVLQDDVLLRAMAVGGLIYVSAAYRATRTLSFFLQRTSQLTRELQRANEMAESLARTDELTGMRNRRAFYEQGELALEQADRYSRPLSLVLLDIDCFKAINDRWGHAAGDQVLRSLAAVIMRSARTTDIAGRIGGEEFAIVLPETSVAEAAAQAERLRGDVAAQPIAYSDVTIPVTCSFGVVEREAEASLDALVARADAALYEAKAQGRNRVVRTLSSIGAR